MLCSAFAGSPPPTRGTLQLLFGDEIVTGITPAYAGNTLMFLGDLTIIGDHPRLRGEHQILIVGNYVTPGSPPPTRGTLLIVESLPMRPGITPAYAGNTSICLGQRLKARDHPRLRGEHLKESTNLICKPGSPPPTRGTRLFPCCGQFSSGITPAYAGNTEIDNDITMGDGDHPRLRGEHPYTVIPPI